MTSLVIPPHSWFPPCSLLLPRLKCLRTYLLDLCSFFHTTHTHTQAPPHPHRHFYVLACHF